MKKKSKNPSKMELRHEAEAKWSERKKKTGPLPVTEADIRRLVHELQVHQIELEMQNEELMQARAELEAALRQYTDLYDFAPVSYFTLARDGAIHQVNLTGANLLSVERSKLVDRRFGVYVSPESGTIFNTFLEKVFGSQQMEICEVALQRDGLVPLWVRIEAISGSSRGQHGVCHAVVRDITERKRAEEELKYLSTHDALTGLYNRSFFVEEMARIERGRKFPVSIVMADVNQLKETNDQGGHAAGDLLLKRVAQVLTSAFRAEDVIARIGGDEFATLLPATDAATAEVSLQRVRRVILENNSAHTDQSISLSLGVSTAKEPASLSEVLKEADDKMYREKRGRDAA